MLCYRVEAFEENLSKNTYKNDKTIEEPDYLPMSPGGRLSTSQDTYVTMANIMHVTSNPAV